MTTERWADEHKLIEALSRIIGRCDEWQVDLLLIGAFAVRAYAERRRLTTDLDFVTTCSSQHHLAALFESLGYEYKAHTRFGGVQAVKYLDEQGTKIQVDIAIDAIRDQNSGNVYRIPDDAFRQKIGVEIVSTGDRPGVRAYVLPLSDLLITKLIVSRDQDAVDVINIVLGNLPSAVVADFKRKVAKARLATEINARLGEMVNLPPRTIQGLMRDYTGGHLTDNDIRRLKRALRQLRI
ncbi:hypothetical protein D6833_11880 [Candidatus Parcubacteria bacterium]|nr:MAG: hypothetical protein D6833_11880 [Candidatus Parcubacteria bacterium]